MKKISFIILFIVLVQVQLLSQDYKSVVSFSGGMNIKLENSAYIDFDDPDFQIWVDPSTHAIFCFSYDYRLNDILRIGARLEHEKIDYESFYTDKSTVKRTSFGFEFLAQYPKTPFHAELGGFGNFGRISSDDFDNNLMGIENGIIAGPAFQAGPMEMSFQFQSCFGYYFLPSNEAPASALIMYPRLMLKVGYMF
jgi:hypothetical protein